MPAFPIFIICVYLFYFWRCKKRLAESDEQLKPCINWAQSNGLQIPKRPSFIAFYIVSINDSFIFFRAPFVFLLLFFDNLQFVKDVKYYEKQMKLLFEKWQLEKNN